MQLHPGVFRLKRGREGDELQDWIKTDAFFVSLHLIFGGCGDIIGAITDIYCTHPQRDSIRCGKKMQSA